jgi:hypothetical protein
MRKAIRFIHELLHDLFNPAPDTRTFEEWLEDQDYRGR